MEFVVILKINLCSTIFKQTIKLVANIYFNLISNFLNLTLFLFFLSIIPLQILLVINYFLRILFEF